MKDGEIFKHWWDNLVENHWHRIALKKYPEDWEGLFEEAYLLGCLRGAKKAKERFAQTGQHSERGEKEGV